MMQLMVKLVMVEDKCKHLNVDFCNALTMQPCTQCVDCGQHGIKPGKGATWKRLYYRKKS